MHTIDCYTIHQSIQKWYKTNGRHDLPWRTTNDPYAIYLSEIMLQQTQVKTVLERFYFPFLERFPTLGDVPTATEDEVLKLWEGLGYYTRARNLHKCAQLCDGKLPVSAEELEKLPGIGRSTARAVACFAFGEALPILDANVKRILYRFFAKTTCTDKELWALAEKLFDTEASYTYNQAMMDIGAVVCMAKSPQCDSCPLESGCKGKGNPLKYPKKKAKKARPIRKRTLLIYEKDGKYALRQNRERLLNGLWGFYQSEDEVIGTFLGKIVHHYSHFTLDADVVLSDESPDESVACFARDEIDALALSRADLKALVLLDKYRET